MKTDQFIYAVKRLRGLELKVETYDEVIVVRNRIDDLVLLIDGDELCNIDTRCSGFRNLNDVDKIELYMLCNRYVTSSVEEREEPKKYKLKHKLAKGYSYLNYDEGAKELRFSTEKQIGVFKTVFTIQEWESLTEQTWEDLLIQFKAVEENVQ